MSDSDENRLEDSKSNTLTNSFASDNSLYIAIDKALKKNENILTQSPNSLPPIESENPQPPVKKPSIQWQKTKSDSSRLPVKDLNESPLLMFPPLQPHSSPLTKKVSPPSTSSIGNDLILSETQWIYPPNQSTPASFNHHSHIASFSHPREKLQKQDYKKENYIKKLTVVESLSSHVHYLKQRRIEEKLMSISVKLLKQTTLLSRKVGGTNVDWLKREISLLPPNQSTQKQPENEISDEWEDILKELKTISVVGKKVEIEAPTKIIYRMKRKEYLGPDPLSRHMFELERVDNTTSFLAERSLEKVYYGKPATCFKPQKKTRLPKKLIFDL